MKEAVIRAIDVGYGNTKFTVGMTSDGDTRCAMFPSVAPIAMAGRAVEGHMDQKDTVLIEVNGDTYEVGPDAMLGMASNASRSLDLDFSAKDSYMALVRGAISYMNVDAIDYLVVGLPVSSMEAMHEKLRQRLTGVHKLQGGKQVEVKEVKVVPQPVGGMVDYAVRNMQLKQMQSGLTLLIDPGYFTLDFVVAQGMKMVGVRSGAANNAGMAAIVRAVSEKLAKKVKERDGRPADVTESVLMKIDEALRGNGQVRFNGRMESLDEFKGAYAPVIADALNKMRARVGSLSDIDRVILVGGAASVYEPAVSEMFAGYDVRVAKDSVFSNVRGFQMIGMQQMALKAPKAMEAAA